MCFLYQYFYTDSLTLSLKHTHIHWTSELLILAAECRQTKYKLFDSLSHRLASHLALLAGHSTAKEDKNSQSTEKDTKM